MRVGLLASSLTAFAVSRVGRADPVDVASVARQSIDTAAGKAPVRFIVSLKPDASSGGVHNLSVPSGDEVSSLNVGVRQLPHLGMAVVDLQASASVSEAENVVSRLQQDPAVERVYGNAFVQAVPLDNDGKIPDGSANASPSPAQEAPVSPNDQYYPLQWGLDVMGAPHAWRLVKGDEPGPPTRVMIIDSGVQRLHPDLEENLWKNEAEINGIPGVDDDGNGYIDDLYGWNAIQGTGDPEDDDGHGTLMAGVIGAATNNTSGIAGTNWKPEIASCKFLDFEGYGDTSDAITCIDYAMAIGAYVTNNSWGSPAPSDALLQALTKYADAGGISLCASGNYGMDFEVLTFYPAGYDVPGLISVGALTHYGGYVAAPWSNFGKGVHLFAPGEDIVSTYLYSNYIYASGTSLASPYVAGVVSLMRKARPELDPTAISLILSHSTVPFEGSDTKSDFNGYLAMDWALDITLNFQNFLALMPGTMTCENACMQAHAECNEETAKIINTDLHKCAAAIHRAKIGGTFLPGEYKTAAPGALPNEEPTGCFTSFHASTYIVNVNMNDYGTRQYGCRAPPTSLSTTTRVCPCFRLPDPEKRRDDSIDSAAKVEQILGKIEGGELSHPENAGRGAGRLLSDSFQRGQDYVVGGEGSMMQQDLLAAQFGMQPSLDEIQAAALLQPSQ